MVNTFLGLATCQTWLHSGYHQFSQWSFVKEWSLKEVRGTVPWALSGLCSSFCSSHTPHSSGPQAFTLALPSACMLVPRIFSWLAPTCYQVSTQCHLLWPPYLPHAPLCPVTLFSILHGTDHVWNPYAFLCLLTDFISCKYTSSMRADPQ